jgi:hypothetical protein
MWVITWIHNRSSNCGRLPNQRVRPALPLCTKNASLLTSPIVAKHSLRIKRISFDGNRKVI